MYFIPSPWVIKLWEFSFPKLKIKTTPFFLISRIFVSHWKNKPFWWNGYEHGCTLWSGLAGPDRHWESHRGFSHQIWAQSEQFVQKCMGAARPMMEQPWDSNGGSSAERGLKLIKPLASPTKVDFNSISRFCANAQTWWGTKSLYLSREQKIRYLQVTTCRELFPTTVAVDTL